MMGNITINRIDVTMTDTQLTAVKNALATIAENMPFLLGLSAAERKSIHRINVANKAFAEDALNVGVNNPSILTDYLKSKDLQSDLTLFTQLDEISLISRQLASKIEDTRAVAGNEAYTLARNIYSLTKTAAKAGVPGMTSIYTQLKERFANQGNRTKGSRGGVKKI